MDKREDIVGLKLAPYLFDADDHDSTSSDGMRVHLWDYVQVVLQRLPLVMGLFLGIVLITALYTFTRTPRFTATSQLLVETSQVDLTDLKDTSDSSVTGSSRREFMQTQVRLILSRPVLEKVFTELKLGEDKDFSSARDPIAKLGKKISVIPVRNTFIIDVAIEREDPRQAADIVNAVVSAFMDEGHRRRLGVSEDGLSELRQKADALRLKLNQATESLQQFMVENDMVSFEKTQNVIVSRLRELSSKLTELQPECMALQASVDAAEAAMAAGTPVTSLPDVVAAPVIKEMKLELSRRQNEYSQLLERLGDNHPKLQALEAETQALETRLALESQAILSSIHTRYKQAQIEETLVAEAIAKQEKEVYRFNRLSTQYDALKRAERSIEGPYNTIVRRIEEIDINRIGGQGEQIFVVARATPPLTKSWPKKGKHLLTAMVLGMGMAVVLAFFLEYMDTTVKGDIDVRRLLGSKVLCAVPNVQMNPAEGDMVVINNPKSHAAEAFRSMRTALAFSIPGEHIRSIVVSSALPSEGKSLVAANIAISHAQADRKTLIVDADMRKPRLHRVFGTPSDNGVASLLTADQPADFDLSAELDAVVSKTNVANLDMLPCGPIPDNPAELLESDRFAAFLAAARKRYDFVVIDSPPGFSLVDPLVIAKQVDGLVLVVRSFVTPKAAAQQFTTRLSEADARLLGVVLNNVDTPKAVGYYGYYGHGKYTEYYAS